MHRRSRPSRPRPLCLHGQFPVPVDPIFFLHHANIDRLWDVWARKQESLNLPDLPMTMDDRIRYKEENFYFLRMSQAIP
ncbi:tyrosinase family protein [Ochrobactrum ciceri]|uniref:Tyrosinase family protein n=1 Tax=Brucella ciceri TaxID=391287 RepID=A0ABX1DT26_9HYPH|nr:tyrosinase family protein [Brucella ciceri]